MVVQVGGLVALVVYDFILLINYLKTLYLKYMVLNYQIQVPIIMADTYITYWEFILIEIEQYVYCTLYLNLFTLYSKT